MRAQSLNNTTGAQKQIKDAENFLSTLYSQTNRSALALEHYKKFIALRDTMFSEENKKKSIRTEMNFEFEKKEAIAKEAALALDAITKAESKKQRIILLSVVSCLLLVLIFAAFIFRSLRITRKQKNIIEQQKAEVENQKTEIEKQKQIVDEKQKEVLDSIHYASRIQRALITSEKYFKKQLQRLN